MSQKEFSGVKVNFKTSTLKDIKKRAVDDDTTISEVVAGIVEDYFNRRRSKDISRGEGA